MVPKKCAAYPVELTLVQYLSTNKMPNPSEENLETTFLSLISPVWDIYAGPAGCWVWRGAR